MDCRDGAVLITGASGFIGRHITRRLLRNGRSLVVLMRARGQNAQERLQRVLGTRIAGRPVRIVAADLSKPDLGLDSTPLWRLAGPIETVVHCAGDTTFFPRDIAAARAVCIDGPLTLLASLRPGGLRRWVQISTAYVCGERSGTVFEHERDVGQSFHNPYERLKLLAELALDRRCGELGVDLRVARPSIVVGPPCVTPGSRPSNLFRVHRYALCARAPAACERALLANPSKARRLFQHRSGRLCERIDRNADRSSPGVGCNISHRARRPSDPGGRAA